MRRLLAWLGLSALAVLAVAGLLLSAGFVLVSTEAGRSFLVPRLLAVVNDQIAGRVELAGFETTGSGGLALRGLRILDPRGEPVLELRRAEGQVDLGRLRARRISLRLAAEGLRLRLAREQGEEWNLLQAVALRRPGPPSPSRPLAWTVRVSRLEVSDAAVSLRDAGSPEIRAEGLHLLARALLAPGSSRAELSLRGDLTAPAGRPLSLVLAASQVGDHLSVPQLRASIGETVLDLVAEGSPALRTGRLAVLGAMLRPEEAALLDARAQVAPLTASAYAEADGKVASAAVSLRPAGGGGTGDAAVALLLPPSPRAAGLELLLDRLDPSRISPLLPPGELRVAASGHAAGADWQTLVAAVQLRAEPSRLRGGRFGPLSLRGRAREGRVEVSRLDAVMPGATLAARGSWMPLGAVSASLVASAPDLGTFARNLSALTGERLPRLGGGGRIEGSLAGTARDPQARLTLRSQRLEVEDAVATGASLEAQLTGPAGARQARLDAGLGRLSAPGLEARNLTAKARLAGAAAEFQISALLPDVGSEPFSLQGAGALSDDRSRFTLAQLSLAWPGTRLALAAPAHLELGGPRVDRLELGAGPQRLWVEGGLSGSELDARAGAEAIDLARLPSRLLPAGLGLAGTLSAQVAARGPARAPLLTARADLRDGAARGLVGFGATAEARIDLAARRAAGTLALRDLADGSVDLSADLPLDPRRARTAEPLRLDATAQGLDVAALLQAADLAAELRGRLALRVRAGGTVGAPTFAASAALTEGGFQEYEPLAVEVTAEERASRAAWTLAVDLDGDRALAAQGSVALDLAAALRDPEQVVAGLSRAPLEARAAVPGLELSRLTGRGRLPEGLAGRLQATLEVRGSAAAPRGELAAGVTGLAHRGWSGLDVAIEARAADGTTSATATARASGRPLLSAALRLGLSAERLRDPRALRAAPLSGSVEGGSADLAALRAPAPLAGSAHLRARLGGSLAAPELSAEAGAERLVVDGRPVGDVRSTVRLDGGALAAQARVAAAAGGTAEAQLEVSRSLDLASLERGDWREAPARLRLAADALDLGLLPSVAPGAVRSASGRLDLALAAEGPLLRLRPAGTVRVSDGRANLVGAGEWHGIALQAALAPDAVRVERLAAGRGRGSLQGSGSITHLDGEGPARIEARLTTERLLLSSAGQDLATLDLVAQLTGTATAGEVKLELTIPEGSALLSGRPPRQLQSLEPRADIVVGVPRPPEPGLASALRAELHLLVPARFKVRSLVPKIDVTLRGDTTFRLADGALTADGRMETVEGVIEAYGRQFQLRRAVVVFTGEAPGQGAVDAEALWNENPAARVKISVTGLVSAPDVKMTSEPPLDEGTIALLIATGRTEPKAGAGGVSGITGEEAGSALLGALATKALRDVLQDKLPIDVVPVSATQIRAGVYLTDRVYLGYVRRLDANLEQGQNANEGRVEWQFLPGWTFETRFGDAATGSAGLVWSKDY